METLPAEQNFLTTEAHDMMDHMTNEPIEQAERIELEEVCEENSYPPSCRSGAETLKSRQSTNMSKYQSKTKTQRMRMKDSSMQ